MFLNTGGIDGYLPVVVVVCLKADGTERETWVLETVLVEQDAETVVRETNPGSFVELGKQITKRNRGQ